MGLKIHPGHVHAAIHDQVKTMMAIIEGNGDPALAPIISACRQLTIWTGWRAGNPIATRTVHDQLGEIRDQLGELKSSTNPTTHLYADLEVISGHLRHAQVEAVVLLDSEVGEYTLTTFERDCRNYSDPPLHGN